MEMHADSAQSEVDNRILIVTTLIKDRACRSTIARITLSHTMGLRLNTEIKAIITRKMKFGVQ